jgi:hypothetical protein
MRIRDRRPDEQPRGDEPPPGGGGQNIDRLHQAAQGFLDAGSAAINEALAAGNSEAFLAASRQSGGQ